MASAIAFVRQHRDRFVDELKDFVSIPSVSADARRRSDMERCAAWLAEHLRSIGMRDAAVLRTAGHPLVLARTEGERPDRPTVLVYGHYDVQPEGRREDWHSPPFAGTIQGSNLYARGASDDKGQLFAHVKALEAYLAADQPPVNVACLFDGEEEIGSPSLIRALPRLGGQIKADAVVISDTRIPSSQQPALTYSLRGAVHLDVTVRGASRDLHAGYFGGAAPNALQHLARLISALHRPDGRIAIDGFYDAVRPPENGWNSELSRYDRTTVLPCLTVTRIATNPNAGRATIPAWARASIDIRLVPDQRPADIVAFVKEHIGRSTPVGMRASVDVVGAARPVALSRKGPTARAAEAAYQSAFFSPPVFLRSGGSIPIVAAFQDVLAVPIVLMGFGLPDDGAHGPNEKFHLPTFFRGIETSLWFMQYLRQAGATSVTGRLASGRRFGGYRGQISAVATTQAVRAAASANTR